MQPTKQKLSGRTKASLWLMIGPAGLLVVTFLLYAIMNAILGANGSTGASPVILNIILFLAGVVGVISFIPGIIIGAILLATKK